MPNKTQLCTLGNKRPGPLVELIINTSTTISEFSWCDSSKHLYLNGMHLPEEKNKFLVHGAEPSQEQGFCERQKGHQLFPSH